MSVLPTERILKTVLAEHESEEEALPDFQYFSEQVAASLRNPAKIPHYTHHSSPLSVVSFRCLLQDTGLPTEVYLPGDVEQPQGVEVDWHLLKERWIGWGVEIPGEQSWTSLSDDAGPSTNGMQAMESRSTEPALPPPTYSKYPLPGKGGDYLGALIKSYDDTIFKPASAYTFIGILSSATLPIAEYAESEATCVVPTLHVLSPPKVAYPIPAESRAPPDTARTEEVRQALIEYLATAFEPSDTIAAEYLLLLLLSASSARPRSLPPLGTLSINFLRSTPSTSTRAFEAVLSSITPLLVLLPLSIPLLHSANFFPTSGDSSHLDAGLLQLAAGTVLLVEEDDIGEGGQLDEKAAKNLQALVDCTSQQTVRYEYPYMDDLKMDCDVRVAVLSEGKSLLPVDVWIPLSTQENKQPSKLPSHMQLLAFRTYLAHHSSAAHSAKLVIPDEIAERIQDDFVRTRRMAWSNGQTGNESPKSGMLQEEDRLKQQMRIARLLAISHPEALLTEAIWGRTKVLEEEVGARLRRREEERQGKKHGDPLTRSLRHGYIAKHRSGSLPSSLL